MRAESERVLEIFRNDRALRVPFYQRAYVWEPDPQLRRFVQSLEYVVENQRPYFLGSIILKSENPAGISANAAEQFIVIDGQQRLTTIAVFLKALMLTLNRNEEFRSTFLLEDDNTPIQERHIPTILHGGDDRTIFNEIICAETPVLEAPNGRSTQLKNAFRYFCKYLLRRNDENEDNLREGITPRDLYYALRNQIMIVKILLGPDENEQQIFDTINSAGTRLTTGELLKNYLFDSNQMEDSYRENWYPLFEQNDNISYWRQSITAGRNTDTNIDTFFYALMLIKVFEGNIVLTDRLKRILRHKDMGMFENYKRLIPTYIDKETIIQEINRYGNRYKEICTGNDVLTEDLPTEGDVRRLYCFMQASQTMTMVPYILYVCENQVEETERSRMFALLESYVMRRVIVGTSNHSYSDLFSENLISNRITTYEGLHEYIEGRVGTDLEFPSDEQVKNALLHRDCSKNARVILYMLESKLLTAEDSLLPYDSFISIPMMPKNVSEAWPMEQDMTDDDRKELYLCLANFALYQSQRKKISRVLENTRWRDKKYQLLEGLNIATRTNRSIVNSEGWSRLNIVERADELSELILEAWPLDIPVVQPQEDVADNNAIEDINITFDNNPEEDLPNELGISIWRAMGRGIYRDTFMDYLRETQGVTNQGELRRVERSIRDFFNRINVNQRWRQQYRECRDVQVFREFVIERAKEWRFYNEENLNNCLLFIDFLRHCNIEQIPNRRRRRKIQLSDGGNTHHLWPKDAFAYVINKVGANRFLHNEAITYQNRCYIIDRPAEGYEQLEGTNYYVIRVNGANEYYKQIVYLKKHHFANELADVEIQLVQE